MKRDQESVAKRKVIFYNALVETNGIVSHAAELCGIDRLTHFSWMRNDQEYKEKVNSLLDLQIDLCEKTLINAINTGDVQSAMFLLRYRGQKYGYVLNKNMDITITDKTLKFNFGGDQEIENE